MATVPPIQATRMLLHPFTKSRSRHVVDHRMIAHLSSLGIERARLLSEDQTRLVEDTQEQRLPTMSMKGRSLHISPSRFRIDVTLQLDLCLRVMTLRRVDGLAREAYLALVKEVSRRLR